MNMMYLDQHGRLGGGELAIMLSLRVHSEGARFVFSEDGPFRNLLEECGIPVEVFTLGALKGVRRESGFASMLSSFPAFASLCSHLLKLAD